MLDQKNKYYGFYRAKVVDNKDPDKRGQILVWIPDLMTKIPQDQGIWALPANNPLGGRDPNNQLTWKQGCSYIPVVGSWVWIFFEGGNPSRPYYFGAIDIEQSKVVVENQVGTQYWNKWTIIRSRSGRVIIVSDDPDDERVEITGKKRAEANKLDGDTTAIYTINGNQTTILIDERAGKEKVLIMDHNGNAIELRTHSNELHIFTKSDIVIQTNANLSCKVAGNIDISCTSFKLKASSFDLKIDQDTKITSGGQMHVKCGGEYHLDASHVHEQDGTSVSADGASPRSAEVGRDE